MVDFTVISWYYHFMGGDSMPISTENTRTIITISKKLKAKLEEQAKKEHRSFNNLVISILSDYAENI